MKSKNDNFLGKKRIRKFGRSPSFQNSIYQSNNGNISDSDINLNRKSEINIENLKYKNINYEIESWSSYISTFHPKNILLDNKISDHVSKWSVDFKSQNEFLFLKLEKTSIIYMITFGKFKDPTNLKEFKIYAGLTKSNLTEILHSGLSMDNEYETFTVKFKLDKKNSYIPSNYLKIVPIRPWVDNYNISIWFINLKGVDDESIVKQSIKEFHLIKESEDMKNWLELSRKNFKFDCLNLFKVKGFNKLIEKIEDPLISNLYKNIITGNFENCESILNLLLSGGFLNDYIKNLPYKITWKQLDFIEKEVNNCLLMFSQSINISADCSNNKKQNTNNENVFSQPSASVNEDLNDNADMFEIESELSGYSIFPAGLESPIYDNLFIDQENFNHSNNPPCRGGHTMVIDNENSIIYLFGGWDGSQDLNDFWSFDINNETWKLISSNTSEQKGPSPRSCHKMVFDNKYNRIFIYGQYSKIDNLECNLYEYDLKNSKWTKHYISKELKNNQMIDNNPGLIFDHQIALDSENQILYVFGGTKVHSGPQLNSTEKYLGLWKLDIKNKYWENILNEESEDPYDLKLKTRFGHTMLLDSKNNELIIFGGNKGPRQNNSSYSLFDMLVYNIDNRSIREIFHDFSKDNGPFVNFSTCSYLNNLTNEMYFFGGGYTDEKQENISNYFWILNFDSKKWIKAEPNIEVNYEKINILNNFYNEFYQLNYSEIETKFKFGKKSSLTGKSGNSNNINSDTLNQPIPRYAHTMVFSSKLNRGFIFGGNSNIKNSSNKSERLNDFWSFELRKVTLSEMKEKILFKIYKLYYVELINDGYYEKALELIRLKISRLSFKDKLKRLSLMLFQDSTPMTCREDKFLKRYNLYEYIREFISIPIENTNFLNR